MLCFSRLINNLMVRRRKSWLPNSDTKHISPECSALLCRAKNSFCFGFEVQGKSMPSTWAEESRNSEINIRSLVLYNSNYKHKNYDKSAPVSWCYFLVLFFAFLFFSLLFTVSHWFVHFHNIFRLVYIVNHREQRETRSQSNK